ncbi:palmitoyltransferase Pfa4p [Trichomonascus vanleenenianus]|uniref:palmitoyltransferase PFA4 n=1 Tax=Trichomonascus vanleenenianus TaxID=2268995 RepID=UPI003EC98FC2
MIELSWPLLGVVVPSILITVGGYGTYFFILVPHHSSPYQLVLLQFMLTMTWISYAMAILKKPGSPPPNFAPEENELRRWCVKCNNYKPDRAHHCRRCQTCVLKMDHHCPWTYNCVGHSNMPHFIRFLLWVDISCSYGLYHLIKRAIDLYQSRRLPAYMVPKSEIVMTVILTPLVFFILFSVGLLTLRVFTNIINGMSQIEQWESERVASLVRRGLAPRVEFPYDNDPWTNLLDAWGDPWTWFLPWGKPRGDGLHFAKNEEDGIWPPDHTDYDRPVNYGVRHEATLSASSVDRLDTPATHRYNSTVPDWRRSIRTESDFYRSDQWHNYEGETIADFGVDIDTVRPCDSQPRAPSDTHESDEENVPLAHYVR